ncbi:MAG: transcription termination/antitermination protein NusA [Candidatus Eisenbacteria bacterium]|nr:transcription termination/antitermination protein NusA [Candidatus Eisenbacteria bacterium]
MSQQLVQALESLARERGVDRATLVETLENSILSAAKKKLGLNALVDVKFDDRVGTFHVVAHRTVVDVVEDASFQMTVEEARAINPEAAVGDTLDFPQAYEEFGRNAIQAAKQVLIQRVREAERDRVYREYEGKVGQLVRGMVQQVDRGNVLVKLDRTEALLPAREMMPRDRYHQSDIVRAVIQTVEKESKGPQVILSRTNPEFLKHLFRAEVPEISEGIVEIKGVAREAGSRSKIAVTSHEDRVDAVGSCVGGKGARVQSIVRALGGERIDTVPWSMDASIYVSRSLSPAKVVSATPKDEAEKTMEVVVADDQLSLAIGKLGQNARLATKLTGWKIELISRSDLEARRAAERALRVDIEDLTGVSEKIKEKLVEEGIETVADLEVASLERLQEIPGIGEKTAEKLLARAREVMEEVRARATAGPAESAAPGEDAEGAEAATAAPDDEAEGAEAAPAARPEEPAGEQGAESGEPAQDAAEEPTAKGSTEE